MLDGDDLKGLIGTLATTFADHAEELTNLDSAIGDGDHGLNMKRGFEALQAEADIICAKPIGEAFKAAGMKLVMTVGGASGPLFGTFLMTMGKELGGAVDRAAVISAFRKSVDAVAARGKSEKGQKTLLDVLYPIADALEGGATVKQAAEVAKAQSEATIPVLATRGRASFLGERSIGHMDPGARSTALIAQTLAAWMEIRA